jgi:thiol:disulfide interchange protein
MKIIHFFTFVFTFLFITNSISQIELPEDKVSWDFSVTQTAKEKENCEATIIGKVRTVKDWHINAIKLPAGSFGFATSLKFKKNKNYTLVGGVIEPKPIEKYDKYADETLAYHEGTVIFKQKIKINSEADFTIEGEFEFQTCNEVKCLPNYLAELKVKTKSCKSEAAILPENTDTNTNQVVSSEKEDTKIEKTEDENSGENSTKKPVIKEEKKSLISVFIAAFFSGFLALIMPCVFPMIPMTVSFFTKRSKTKSEGIRNSFLYGGSIVLIHVLLGAIVVITGAGHILNELSTNVWFNIFFFLMLFLFGLSFLGAFEIQLPSKWVNAADAKADKGGFIGIFFMALVLSLASFSCTGPILGSLLGGLSAYGGGTALMVGMFAFGLALALPFMLFSIFPSMLNSIPSSGGWLNVVKVFLGFLEIAFAFKFLSTADTTMQWHLLEREIFISIWIAVFGTLALYLFGKIRLPHDSDSDKLSVGRTMMATLTLAFTMYLIPGLWGAPLKLVNAFLPPDFYAESPQGLSGKTQTLSIEKEHVEGMHDGPQGIKAFNDYDKALEYAKKVNKPLFVDFTGWGCVNCRKMEQSVWGEAGIIEHLRNDVVIVSLYVDERTELPKNEQGKIKVNGKDFNIKTIGNKWTAKQIEEYKTSSQPYYVLQTPEGEDIPIGSADYQNHGNPSAFKKWLDKGLKTFKDSKSK